MVEKIGLFDNQYLLLRFSYMTCLNNFEGHYICTKITVISVGSLCSMPGSQNKAHIILKSIFPIDIFTHTMKLLVSFIGGSMNFYCWLISNPSWNIIHYSTFTIRVLGNDLLDSNGTYLLMRFCENIFKHSCQKSTLYYCKISMF